MDREPTDEGVRRLIQDLRASGRIDGEVAREATERLESEDSAAAFEALRPYISGSDEGTIADWVR